MRRPRATGGLYRALQPVYHFPHFLVFLYSCASSDKMKHIVLPVLVLLPFMLAFTNALSVSEASNNFASILFKELAKTPGNVLVCPLSAHIALALVQQGAGGATRTELSSVLHLDDSNDIKTSYKSLLSGLQDDALKIATKLFPAASFKPNAEYISVVKQNFLSDVQPLDYKNAVNAANIINKFVDDKTNHKIQNIVKSDSLKDTTRLVIVNAVHFKAGWAKTFPPSFIDNFMVTPSQSIQTEFMGQTDYFLYKEDSYLEAKILKLDYEGGKYSMVFVLPKKEDGLQELETKMATTSMSKLLSNMRDRYVDITIPKFKIEQEIQLKDVLVKMGINKIFDSRANLTNISEKEGLYVDSVIQKTFIDVNEDGTEASAATGAIVPLSGSFAEKIFSARKPFIYYLINNKIPVILFTGKLLKPKESIKSSLDIVGHKTTKKPEENLNFYDKLGENFNNGQSSLGNNQAGYTNPSNPHGQNLQQNFPQNQWQNTPNNGFNHQNNYETPSTFQSNNPSQLMYQPSFGQNNKPPSYGPSVPVPYYESEKYTPQPQANPQNQNQQTHPTNYYQTYKNY